MSSRTKFVATGLVMLALMVGAPRSASGQEVTLRYRWTQGETLRYRMTQQTTATISGLPGGIGDMTVNTTLSQVLATAVSDVAADGTTTLRQVIESIRMDMTTPVSKITYDSASKEGTTGNPMENMMKDMFSAMIGEGFVIVLSPTGQVQKVEGATRMLEKMLKNAPQDPAGAAAMDNLKQSFTDDAMRSNIAHGLSQLPDRPLEPGDTWDTQFTISNPMFGPVTTSTASTLESVEGSGADQVARIATSVTTKADPTAKGTNPMGFTMQMGDSAGDGESVFHVSKGRVQRGTTRMTMSFSMSGSAPDGTPISMKTTAKSTMTIELIQP